MRARRSPVALCAALAAALLLAPAGLAARPRPSHPEVLVVVNSQSPLSVATGEYYRTSSNVPASNVVALSVPLVDPDLGNLNQEVASQSTFDDQIRIPIENFLVHNGLVDQIEIIVLMPGIPHRFAPLTCTRDNFYLRDCRQSSVDAELAVLFSSLVGASGIGANGEARNPYFDSPEPFGAWRAAHPQAALRYLVARLGGFQTPVDAATGVPSDVKALVDRAKQAVGSGNGLVDEDPIASLDRRGANVAMLGPAAAALAALGLAVQLDQTTTFVSDATSLLAYASWGSNDNYDPGPPYYGSIGGKLYPGTFQARAVALDIVSTNARSFVHPPTYGQSTIADLVRLGVSGVAGSVFEPTLSGVPRPEPLFRHYFSGARAVEAFYRSVPYLSWMSVWIGDPLMTTPILLLPASDGDGDGVLDSTDNCIRVANANQRDTDGDGYGNLCDADLDGDGVVTTSFGVTIPPSARGDLEEIQLTANGTGYDADQDLDGDGDVNNLDVSIASLFLFFPPGPSGDAP